MKYLLNITILFLFGCKTTQEYPYPADKLIYSTDIENETCVEWAIVDLKNIKFQRVQEFPIEAGGPCDHMVGYGRYDIKAIENWARNIQR